MIRDQAALSMHRQRRKYLTYLPFLQYFFKFKV